MEVAYFLKSFNEQNSCKTKDTSQCAGEFLRSRRNDEKRILPEFVIFTFYKESVWELQVDIVKHLFLTFHI